MLKLTSFFSPMRQKIPFSRFFAQILLVTAFAAGLGLAGETQGKTFYVSPDGCGAGAGTLEAPFLSLSKAQQAVREFRASEAFRARPETVEVVLRGGIYSLSEPWVLTPEDSGTADAPNIWRGCDGEHAILSGGKIVTDWKDEGNGLFSAPLEISDPDAGTQLFVEMKDVTKLEGAERLDAVRRAVRARTPNICREDAAQSYFWVKKDLRTDKRNCDEFRMNQGEIDGLIYDKNGKILPDVQLVTFQNWSSSFNRIASYDAQQGIVKFPRPAGSYYLRHIRCFVENSRQCLDVPGEWFFDRVEKRIYYIPQPDEDLNRVTVRISVVPRWLVAVAGDWAHDRPVSYVHFKNLVFSYADADLSPDYENSVQCAHTQRGTLNAVGLQHSEIEGCEFSHNGENGITFMEGCSWNVVRQNHLFDLGAGGAALAGLNQGPKTDERLLSAHNRIENNLIHHTSTLFHSASGILFCSAAPFNQVLHNEISNVYWAGTQFGWCWSSVPKTFTHHNEIAYNHIHHYGQGVMCDLAGIYTLGDADGTVIHHNNIHDGRRFTREDAGYGGWGIYLDQGSSNLTVEFNLVHDTQDGGMNVHYRSDPYNQVIRNNIFAFGGSVPLTRGGPGNQQNLDKPFGTKYERNIVFNLGKWPFLQGNGFAPTENLQMAQNCCWNPDGKSLFAGKMTLSEWQKFSKTDEGSIQADPRFVDAEKRDFRLEKDSPVFALGFQEFDVSTAGLYGSDEWKALAKKVVNRPDETYQPPAKPREYAEGFESGGLSEFFPSLNEADWDKASVKVTDETAHSGKFSLKVTDAPGLKNVYDPHLWLPKSFDEGELEVSYWLRAVPGASIACEWRQTQNVPHYISGPNFRMTPAGDVFCRAKKLTQIPQNEWVKFTLRCRNGERKENEARTWSLTVLGQTFADLPMDPDFALADWFGFISSAETDAVFYLDDMEIHVR